MLIKTPTILLLNFCIIISLAAKAGSTDSIAPSLKYNKIISLNLLGPGTEYALNNAWVLKNNARSKLLFQVNSELWFPKNSYISKRGYNMVVGFALIKQFGRKNHHFNLGIGHSFVFEKSYNSAFYDPEFTNENNPFYYNHCYLFGDIGYSYWNPSRRFYFKLSVHPILSYQNKSKQGIFSTSRDLNPWFGVTFGYAYNKFIKSRLNADKEPGNFKERFKIGFENNIGYSGLNCIYGKANGFVVSNFVNLMYSPNRLFFNLKFGNSIYGLKKGEARNGAKIALFDKSPAFWNIAFGVGYRLIGIKGWYLSPEITGGTYLTNKISYTIIPEPTEFATTDLLNNTINNYVYDIRVVGFSLQIKKQISKKIEISTGFQYKTTAGFDVKEYEAVFSIYYSLL